MFVRIVCGGVWGGGEKKESVCILGLYVRGGTCMYFDLGKSLLSLAIFFPSLSWTKIPRVVFLPPPT